MERVHEVWESAKKGALGVLFFLVWLDGAEGCWARGADLG